MVKLRKWLALSWAERAIFLQSLLALPILALALRVAGFRRVYGFLLRSSPAAGAHHRPVSQQEVSGLARMVNAAANHGLVQATCLPRSLLAWWLLRRRGVISEIKIGVRVHQGQFEAHAWVQREGIVLNDRPDVGQRFAAFGPWQGIDTVNWV